MMISFKENVRQNGAIYCTRHITKVEISQIKNRRVSANTKTQAVQRAELEFYNFSRFYFPIDFPNYLCCATLYTAEICY